MGKVGFGCAGGVIDNFAQLSAAETVPPESGGSFAICSVISIRMFDAMRNADKCEHIRAPM